MSCREVMVSFKADGPTDMGAVLAEAQAIYEATGLTPSQLQARVAELEAALRGVTGALDQMGDQPDRLVCPEVWRRLNCEELVTLGKEALGVE